MGADDATRDPTGERTKPSADDEAEDPRQVALVVGARTAALEQYTANAPYEGAAGEAKYDARGRPTSGPSMTTLHLDPRERPERDCQAVDKRSATRKVAESKRIAADSGDEARPS